MAVDADGMVPLVELTRGPLVESSHRGALAVVDGQGRLLAAVGNPYLVAYLRSTAKPFQALPTVASGALEHFGLGPRELALMCASHHGTEEHVAVVQTILHRIGLDVAALRCGIHWPSDQAAARLLAAQGQEPDARHNNCSGKHAGMLALARLWDCWQSDYTEPDHPVQQAILDMLAQVTSLVPASIQRSPDGCTVPAFALPLAHTALAFARLIAPDAPPHFRRVVAAMQAFPHLVGGHGALDDVLMQAGQGAIVCKGGAEGYEGMGIRLKNGNTAGIALKVGDGNGRGMGVVLATILEALDLVDSATLARLQPLRRPPITNHRSQVVGEMRPAAGLNLGPPSPARSLEQVH